MQPTGFPKQGLTGFPQRNNREYDQKKDPLEPKRYILDQLDMEKFQRSRAYQYLMVFIQRLNDACKGKKLSENGEVSEKMKRCLAALDRVEGFLDLFPCVKDKSLYRFGNSAFRQFYDKIAEEVDEMMQNIVGMDVKPEIYKELSYYFRECWGNRTRIDYGTGHELHFCAWMFCLTQLNVLDPPKEAFNMVSQLYSRYLDIIRNVQRKYSLEPAGSHGVWGLDDHFFLNFIWGSSQLIDHPSITPKSIHDSKLLRRK